MTILALATILLTATPDDVDPRAAWLVEHAVVPRTVDADDEDFADLEPLVDLIGDARVVGLGEQTHGDGASFDGKVRLVKFLHQRMGFDVLVWECGMVDCMLVDEALRDGRDPIEAASIGIYPIWTLAERIRPVFAYAAASHATERPLTIAGMDSQMMGTQTKATEVRRLLDAALAAAPKPVADEAVVAEVRAGLDRLAADLAGATDDNVRAFGRAADALGAALTAPDTGIAPMDATIAARAIRNAAACAEQWHWSRRAESGDATTKRYGERKSARARETAMGETLVWLAQERYPGRRLIVWAASSHLAYDRGDLKSRDETGAWSSAFGVWTPMGRHAKDALGDDFYVIDFIAYAGEAGTVWGARWPVRPAEAGSIDAICHATGHPFLYVDLRSLAARDDGAWLAEPLVARPRGYAPMRARWPLECDAFFFTDVMTPAERADQ